VKRHIRDNYFVVGEGVYHEEPQEGFTCERPSTAAELRKFRFSRMGPTGVAPSAALRRRLGAAMVDVEDQADADLPAGFTYLGQFLDHDLTQDRTARRLGSEVSVDELLQGRSPALDLDSLYGAGPGGSDDVFYADGVRLKTGRTSATPFPDNRTNVDLEGFDLPRTGFGSRASERRKALIPDPRNDENLAVAQVHLAFIRFHNRVVDHLAGVGTPSAVLFAQARDLVVRHYQWMIRTDYLPAIVDPHIVDDVFTNGRRYFEVVQAGGEGGRRRDGYMIRQPGDTPTMPVEFSVAAFRLGHSMIRSAYQWNRVFRSDGSAPATLDQLFRFSGTSGILSPDGDMADPDSGTFERLPTNWIADFRRLFDFGPSGRQNLAVAGDQFNVAKRIDTALVNPLRGLPLGSFGDRTGAPPPDTDEFNLAFRNLTRAQMVRLASGQQMAEVMRDVVTPLTESQILQGDGGVSLGTLSDELRGELVGNTPLWFYVLREAELNNGRLTGVGGRIVAEVFHRAMEGSDTSIVREPSWRPSLGSDGQTFRMADLLLFAADGRADLLNPLGD